MAKRQPHPPSTATSAAQQTTSTRPFTWVILGVNALFLIWIIAGVAGANPSSDAAVVGTGIGVMLIVALWAFTDVILGILWLVTRKREPQVVIVQQHSSLNQGIGQLERSAEPMGNRPVGSTVRVSPAQYVAQHSLASTDADARIAEDAQYMHDIAHAALGRGSSASEAWALAVDWLLRQQQAPSIYENTLAAAEQQYEQCDRCPDPDNQTI